ncbi:hypothetical protein BGZ76_002092 [Entomortierella beljakovae]|nr:hypothetical protein BGZ76_002092 [Entomortierella beljakovae]
MSTKSAKQSKQEEDRRDVTASQLYDLRQEFFPSVHDYTTRFNDLYSMIPDLSNFEAAQIYFHGLKPLIKARFAGEPHWLRKLQTAQRMAESVDNAYLARQPPLENMDMEIDAMTTQPPSSLRPKLTPQKQKDLANRACFYCHKPGHQARQCCSDPAGKSLVLLKTSGALNGTTAMLESSSIPDKDYSAISESSVIRMSKDRVTFEDKESVGEGPASSETYTESPNVSCIGSISPVNSEIEVNSISPPIEEELLLPKEAEKESLMYVAGTVKGQKLDMMINSGATASFINYEVVKRLNIATSRKKSPMTIVYANGQPELCTQYCHICVKLAKNYGLVIQFNVVLMKFEAILEKTKSAEAPLLPCVSSMDVLVVPSSNILLEMIANDTNVASMNNGDIVKSSQTPTTMYVSSNDTPTPQKALSNESESSSKTQKDPVGFELSPEQVQQQQSQEELALSTQQPLEEEEVERSLTIIEEEESDDEGGLDVPPSQDFNSSFSLSQNTSPTLDAEDELGTRSSIYLYGGGICP